AAGAPAVVTAKRSEPVGAEHRRHGEAPFPMTPKRHPTAALYRRHMDVDTAGRRPHAADRMAAMRLSYAATGLMEADLAWDWLTQFQRWFDDAVESGMTEP